MTTDHVNVSRGELHSLRVSIQLCDNEECLEKINDILSRATPSDSSAELSYAKKLAMVLWERHYKDVAPDFDTLDDLYGVLSQIDNMLTGLHQEKPSAPCVVDDK